MRAEICWTTINWGEVECPLPLRSISSLSTALFDCERDLLNELESKELKYDLRPYPLDFDVRSSDFLGTTPVVWMTVE